VFLKLVILIEMKVYDRKDHCKTKLNKNFNLDTEYKVQNLLCEERHSKKTQGGLLYLDIIGVISFFQCLFQCLFQLYHIIH